ncbi:hypothetical protein O6H91_14G055800 [Diphasiastrum complanatum]|uniref:Uncharacterized protein n=1 Tax=Diphasiastrum complanatum TaxID=34168 RepID=A0ACC2BPK6_DIPCM|nr:hypothetical protein O6H91_14G055800 [Diphasiastrum complanatum]
MMVAQVAYLSSQCRILPLLHRPVKGLEREINLFTFESVNQVSNAGYCYGGINIYNKPSEWEAANNPWWLDFSQGDCPFEEKGLYELHLKGQLTMNEPMIYVLVDVVDVVDALDSKLWYVYDICQR